MNYYSENPPLLSEEQTQDPDWASFLNQSAVSQQPTSSTRSNMNLSSMNYSYDATESEPATEKAGDQSFDFDLFHHSTPSASSASHSEQASSSSFLHTNDGSPSVHATINHTTGHQSFSGQGQWQPHEGAPVLPQYSSSPQQFDSRSTTRMLISQTQLMQNQQNQQNEQNQQRDILAQCYENLRQWKERLDGREKSLDQREALLAQREELLAQHENRLAEQEESLAQRMLEQQNSQRHNTQRRQNTRNRQNTQHQRFAYSNSLNVLSPVTHGVIAPPPAPRDLPDDESDDIFTRYTGSYQGFISSLEESHIIMKQYLATENREAKSLDGFPQDNDGCCRLVQQAFAVLGQLEGSNEFEAEKTKVGTRKNTSINRISNHYWSDVEIELMCWQLLEACRDAQLGINNTPHWFPDKRLAFQVVYRTFRDRWNAVLAELKVNKTMVNGLFDTRYCYRVTWNPTGESKRKVVNKQGNEKKGQQLHSTKALNSVNNNQEDVDCEYEDDEEEDETRAKRRRHIGFH